MIWSFVLPILRANVNQALGLQLNNFYRFSDKGLETLSHIVR